MCVSCAHLYMCACACVTRKWPLPLSLESAFAKHGIAFVNAHHCNVCVRVSQGHRRTFYAEFKVSDECAYMGPYYSFTEAAGMRTPSINHSFRGIVGHTLCSRLRRHAASNLR